jgi:hypothetical protein
MKEFHCHILKTVIEVLQGSLGFKFISFVSGGFQLVHDLALDKNISLVDHNK